MPPSYGPLTVLPDEPLTPVPDCTGQPDFTLCSVVTSPDRSYDVCMEGVCVSPGCGDPTCNARGLHFLVPPRGGAQLEKLPGDEPVTVDKITGLHWQTCVAGVSGAGCDVGTPAQMGLVDALAYCDALAWGGHDDWYLPDPNELMSIGLDPEVSEPGDAAFPNAAAARECQTSSVSYSHGYQVDEYGTATQFDEGWTNSVRCVRRGFSKPARFTGERFESTTAVQGEPTVHDLATELTWLGRMLPRSDGQTGYRIGEAAAACDALVFGGFDDWRVPTYRELHSLFDYPKQYETDAELNPLFPRSGPYVIAAEGFLIGSNGNSVGGTDKLYTAYCVRGPFVK